jgi:hypothetical protein
LRYLLTILLFTCSLASCAQGSAPFQPVTDTLSVALGDSSITLLKSTYGTQRDFLFLQLHDNETAGEEAATKYLKQNGGVFISIENNKERNVSFQLNGQRFTFDPNRIFTPVGLQATLEKLGGSTPEAIAEVQGLAQSILHHLPDSVLIIAIHNNTDEAFSALSYRIDTSYQRDAAALFISDEYDVDDFFLTTEQDLYDSLTRLEYNVVLQDNLNAADDGSLSVYFGKKGVRYINVEAEHGKVEMQLKMIEALLNITRRKNETTF